jgi:uncharacterized membrane protein
MFGCRLPKKFTLIASSILRSKSQISLWLMIAVYLAAGINHFRTPEFYYPIIPDYMGHKPLLNILSGVAEIAGAIGLMIPATRKWAAYGIVAMLIAFLPTHIYMITDADKIALAGMQLPVWAAWVRLVVIQPILIWWAWGQRDK